jgi:hypothetical protein
MSAAMILLSSRLLTVQASYPQTNIDRSNFIPVDEPQRVITSLGRISGIHTLVGNSIVVFYEIVLTHCNAFIENILLPCSEIIPL